MLVVFLLGAILAGIWFKYGAHTAGGRHGDSPIKPWIFCAI